MLILIEEVVWVLVEHHTPNLLEGEHILWPCLGDIQRVKVILELISRVHDLNHELPLGKVACSNGLVQVLGGMAVIGATYSDGLVLEQIFDACADRQRVDVDLVI